MEHSVNYSQIPKYKGFSMKNKLMRMLWRLFELVLFRTSVYPYGRYLRVFLLKRFGAKISWRTIVYPSVRIWAPWNLEIGPRSVLGPGVNCYNPAKIIIGKKVTVSQNSFLCAGGHDVSKIVLPFICDQIVLEDYVWICANSFVKYGVKIGEGAVVGATSSVYSNVAGWDIVGGNPAKFIRKREIERE